MNAVQNFIFDLDADGNQRAIIQVLNDFLMTNPGLTSKIRYRVPFYYRKSWICYLNPIKGDKVEMAFIRGNELSNSQGLLDAKGRKQVAGIELAQVADIPLEALQEIIQEALLLDETVPYASKRTKKT